jgi:5-methylcytosine-specific restriction endonuclease McrA
MARDKNVCQLRYEGCEFIAVHADHIRPKAANGVTALRNGQALCEPCHRQKTQAERRYLQHGTGDQPWPDDPSLIAPPEPPVPKRRHNANPAVPQQIPRTIVMKGW